MTLKVVLDTNVLVSATLWDGSEAQKLLFKLINIDAEIFTSSEMLSEYQMVLKRDFEYSDDEIIGIMQQLMAFLKLINTGEKVNVVTADPDDDKVLECSIASSSEFLFNL